MFHKITNLILLDNYIILVGFKGGEWRSFDLKPLMKKYPAFESLSAGGLYEKGRIDIGGFGIVWNDELDLSSEGIYEKGEKTSKGYSAAVLDIANYLKEVRKANGLSQNDLSHLSGVSQSTIARIEQGDIDPSLGTIERLLSPFGLSLTVH
ncbi:MAG: helix-turn-helix domain-containing protein [Bacillota bacterium]|nr:helix-turn-helix domain-containing protein [Bacillota bacterium]